MVENKPVKKSPVKKKVISIDVPKEPLLIVTDKETVYRLNWIMIRRKIIAFTQLFRLKRKPKQIAAPVPVVETKPKRVRKPKVKEVKPND